MSKTSILFCILLLPALTNAQWLKLELEAPGGVYSLWNSGDSLFAGHDSIFYYSFDSGENWERSTRVPGAEYGITAIKPYNGWIYIGVSSKGVFRTSNLGVSWEPFSDGFTPGAAYEITGMALRDDTLYVSTMGAGLYRRAINGQSVWTEFNFDLPFSTSWNVSTVENIDGDLYAGAGVNCLYYVNRKNTSNWQYVQFDQFNGEMNGVYSFGKSEGKLIAAANQGVYTSADGGRTWSGHYFGIGLIETGKIVTNGRKIVVLLSKSSRFYIYYSTDDGVTWWRDDMQSGAIAYSMAITGGKIWTGRYEGFYYKQDAITSIGDGDDHPATAKKASIALYPNPVTRDAKLTVKFSGIDAGQASVELFNSMGEKVKSSLFNCIVRSEGLIDLETPGLAPGVYIVRLSSGERTTTGKFLLLR